MNLLAVKRISNYMFLVRQFASKKGGRKAEETSTPAQFSFDSYEKQMKSTITHFKTSLEQIRIGRANPSLLDKISVTVGGKRMLLPSLSQIHAKDSQTLMVVLTDEEVIQIRSAASLYICLMVTSD